MAKEFTGVWTPKAIYNNKDLNPWDKYILSDIHNLCSSTDVFFKSNSTISEEVGVSVPSVSRSIKKLVALGLINSVYDGRVRHITQTRALIREISLTNQRDKSESSERLDSIQVKEQLKKHIRIERPFKSKEFDEMWDIWIDERKQQKRKKYTPRGEQATLHNLQKISNNNEKEAIKIIQQSITQGWQGLFALKTGAKRNQLNAEQASKWASGK